MTLKSNDYLFKEQNLHKLNHSQIEFKLIFFLISLITFFIIHFIFSFKRNIAKIEYDKIDSNPFIEISKQ